MGIKLSTNDQVHLLRNTANNFKERLEYLQKVEFDDDLSAYVIELSAIEDVLSDSCVFSLKTEEEIDEELIQLREEADYRSLSRTIYNENRI